MFSSVCSQRESDRLRAPFSPLLFEPVPPSLYVRLRSFIAYLTSEKEYTCVAPVTRSTLLETATIQGTTGRFDCGVFALSIPPISHCFVFPPPSLLFHPDNHSRGATYRSTVLFPSVESWTRQNSRGGRGSLTKVELESVRRCRIALQRVREI